MFVIANKSYLYNLICFVSVLVAVVITLLISYSAQASVLASFKVEPEAMTYCQDFDNNLKKRYLIRSQLTEGSGDVFEQDLYKYTQTDCQIMLSRIISGKVDELWFTQHPRSRIFLGDIENDDDDVPLSKRTFDLSLICLASKVSSIWLSAVDDWQVLNCLQNKSAIQYLNLSNFQYRTLDVRILLQFPNLISLRLSSGKVINLQVLSQLKKLTTLSFYTINLTTKQQLAVGNINSLINLSISSSVDGQQEEQIKISNFNSLTKLDSLKVWYHSSGKIDIKGVGELAALTRLNLSFIDLDNDAYHSLTGLHQLTRLNLAGNKQITTVAPLMALPSLTDLKINETSVSDISPLAMHPGLASRYGNTIDFDRSNVHDLTPYYAAGAENNNRLAYLLACSPDNKEEYAAGKHCNDQQRQCPLPQGYGYSYTLMKNIVSPLCLWWFKD